MLLEVPLSRAITSIIVCNVPLGIHRKGPNSARTEIYIKWVPTGCKILYQVVFISYLIPTTNLSWRYYHFLFTDERTKAQRRYKQLHKFTQLVIALLSKVVFTPHTHGQLNNFAVFYGGS